MNKLWWLLAWSLYWIGDGISKVMNFWIFGYLLYPIYNWCMITSCDISDKYCNETGPWKKEKNDE